MDNAVIECIKQALDLSRSIYKMTTGQEVENIRCEGFDTRDEKVYTVDVSFYYPKKSDLERFLNTKTRVYKRFTFNKETLEMVSFDNI